MARTPMLTRDQVPEPLRAAFDAETTSSGGYAPPGSLGTGNDGGVVVGSTDCKPKSCADQGSDDAPLDLEVVDVDGRDATELTADVVHLEDRIGLARPGLRVDPGHELAAGGRIGQSSWRGGLRH